MTNVSICWLKLQKSINYHCTKFVHYTEWLDRQANPIFVFFFLPKSGSNTTLDAYVKHSISRIFLQVTDALGCTRLSQASQMPEIASTWKYFALSWQQFTALPTAAAVTNFSYRCDHTKQVAKTLNKLCFQIIFDIKYLAIFRNDSM